MADLLLLLRASEVFMKAESTLMRILSILHCYFRTNLKKTHEMFWYLYGKLFTTTVSMLKKPGNRLAQKTD